jgi:4-carboxymuconolactone decarboxylase
MAKAPPSTKRDRVKGIAPRLVEFTNDVLYGDVWERPGLSKRDRSLITIAALTAMSRPDQLMTHIARGLGNGLTQNEIGEVLTHLAFYCGWPAAMSAAACAMDVVEGKADI